MEAAGFIGIDFGTEYTSIVNVTKDKVTVLGEDGETPFAALLAITADNKVFFGGRVKKGREALGETAQLVSPLAELLGTGKSIVINGKECSPMQMTAEYLRALKRVVMKKYGVDISEAVISFPGAFSRAARLDVLEAAKKAEIGVKGLIPGQYAAYLSARRELADKKSVLIADWGGSTLDIHILMNDGERVRERAALCEKIGGKDIDIRVAQRLHAMLGATVEDKSLIVPFEKMPAADRDKLINLAEAAKIRISTVGGEVPINVQDYGKYGTRSAALTEEIFADIVKPIVKEHVMTAINTVMARTKIKAADIGAVLACGGSGGLRAFMGVLKSIFGEEKVIFPEKPQIVSACGAAMSQSSGGGFRLLEDIGVVMSDDNIFPLLKKDSDVKGLKSAVYSFAAVDDSGEAQIVVADGRGRVRANAAVSVGGFLNERLEISALVDETLTASVRIHNSTEEDPAKDTVLELENAGIYYS